MKLELPVEDANKILSYLSRCPYADVAALVAMLQNLKKIEEPVKQ